MDPVVHFAVSASTGVGLGGGHTCSGHVTILQCQQNELFGKKWIILASKTDVVQHTATSRRQKRS